MTFPCQKADRAIERVAGGFVLRVPPGWSWLPSASWITQTWQARVGGSLTSRVFCGQAPTRYREAKLY